MQAPTFTIIAFILLISAVTVRSGIAQESAKIMRLAEGVFACIVEPGGNAVSNSGIIVLSSGVLVFDTHFTPEAGYTLRNEIAKLTRRPVRYIVNSHFHPDHTHGNQAFTLTKERIASTNTRRDMIQKDRPAMDRTIGVAQTQLEKLSQSILKVQDERQRESMRRQIQQREAFLDRMAQLKILPPSITLDDCLTVREGNREVRLIYFGSGHTDGDIVLFLPRERIVFVGDLFFNHGLPNTQDASLMEWMKSLDGLLNLDAEIFVPGHGPIGNRADVKQFKRYLQDLKALVEPLVTKGYNIEQVIREVEIPEQYASYDFQSFFEPNVQRMYIELRSIQLASEPPSLSPARGPTPPLQH